MIIYKTTNLKNGKFYIGKDAKNNPNYLGSGILLKNAISRYGKRNFKKEILEQCDTIIELNEREQYWINVLSSTDKNIGYNIAKGGDGGDTGGTGGVRKGNIPWNKGTKNVCHAWNKGVKGYMGANKTSYKSGKDHPFYGKSRDPKIYEKIVEARKLKNNYGAGLQKKVINIEDGKIFNSILEAASFYNIHKGKVGYSCRKETKKGKFRFLDNGKS
jgi:group I intron endonuclease